MSFPFPNSLDVPLFPLPGIVLFPGALLPLRIFEPRYVAMLTDVLATSDQWIGMAQIKPGEFAQQAGNPEIFSVLGVGRVVAHQKLADGTSQIVLLGQARCRIESEEPHEPYRMARVVTLIDEAPSNPSESEQLKRETAELKKLAHVAADSVFEDGGGEALQKVLQDAGPGLMADVLAGMCVHDATLRQALLENTHVQTRVRTLCLILKKLLDRAGKKVSHVARMNDEICLN